MTGMTEVRTADLIGPALDWAVAVATGADPWLDRGLGLRLVRHRASGGETYSPSTDWEQGGPLLEKYGVLLSPPRSMMHVCGGPNAGWQETGRWGATIFGRDRKHRRYHKTEDLHETKADAIAYGRKKLEAQRIKIQKQLDNIEKRANSLDKAEAKLAECAE